MALLTSCQHTFQSVAAYEDALGDVETLKVQVHECYSEITKTSNEILSSVKDTYIEKSDMEKIQQDFQTSITQNSSEIRMDFTAVTDEIKNNVASNQELLEEYIRFKEHLLNLEKSVMHLQQSFLIMNLPLRRTDRRLLTFRIRVLLLRMQKLEISCLLEMTLGDGLILYQELTETFQSSGEGRHHKGGLIHGFKRKYHNRTKRRPFHYIIVDAFQSEYRKEYIYHCLDTKRFGRKYYFLGYGRRVQSCY